MDNMELILRELRRINERLEHIEDGLQELHEDHQVTRSGVNKLLEWSENAGYIIHFPLDKAQ